MRIAIEPVLWSITYPVNPNDPVGWIRRRMDGFHAQLQQEPLGVCPNRDAAAEAVWKPVPGTCALAHEIVVDTRQPRAQQADLAE